MDFKSYIINLPGEKLRRDFMKNQMKDLDLNHIFIPAVTVSDISQNDYLKEGMGWERPLRKTELACFLSHKKAWEAAAHSNTHSLILEDDALLSSSCKDIIRDVTNFIDFDFICLETRFRRKKLIGPIQKSIKGSFARLYQDRAGAAAYILSPKGAQKLCDRSNHIKPGLADAYISSAYELNAYQIIPALAIQLDQCEIHNLVPPIKTQTSINEARPKINLSILTKYSFIYRRVLSQVRLASRILSKRLKASFKEIPIATGFGK